MDLSRLEQLAIDCAMHSQAIEKYRELGSDSWLKCTSAYEYSGGILLRKIGDTCLQKVYRQYGEFTSKGDYRSFEEYYSSLDEGEVCEHCQIARLYKTKRIEAQKKLGYARSAITQAGKRLLDQTNIKGWIVESDGCTCPICEMGRLTLHTEKVTVEYLGQQGQIDLQYEVCDFCGSEQVGNDEARFNKQAMIDFKNQVKG